MNLSVSDQFYISSHRDVPEKELAKVLGLGVRTVRAAIKKLPPIPVEEPIPETPEPPKPEKLAKFAIYSGVTSMTHSQALDDDDTIKNSPPNISKGKGIHIMDPSKPVR